MKGIQSDFKKASIFLKQQNYGINKKKKASERHCVAMSGNSLLMEVGLLKLYMQIFRDSNFEDSEKAFH